MKLHGNFCEIWSTCARKIASRPKLGVGSAVLPSTPIIFVVDQNFIDKPRRRPTWDEELGHHILELQSDMMA